MTTTWTTTMTDVKSVIAKIESGVKERFADRSLTPAELKLFHSVLSRTKSYFEMAKSNIEDLRYREGAD